MLAGLTAGAAGCAALLAHATGASAPDTGAIRRNAAAGAFTTATPQSVGDQGGDVGGSFEIAVRLRPGDSIRDLLVRAGITDADATRAASLIEERAASGLGPDPEIALLAGDKAQDGRRHLARLTVRTDDRMGLIVSRKADGLRLTGEAVDSHARLMRFRGTAGDSLYWSLRAAGTPSEAAVEFQRLLDDRQPPAAAEDRFDLIVAMPLEGRDEPARLLYLALEPARGRAVRLVSWNSGDRRIWVDPDTGTAPAATFIRPVRGRISSQFGSRQHPILQLIRFHRGIDIAAPRGTPVLAAADGQVLAAGRRGGYGQQVRLRHSGGMETSYSHLSRIVAIPGSRVRQGEPIGFVGSTGLSTGAHLHYELHVGGRPVDPTANRALFRPEQAAADRAAVAARLDRLIAASRSSLAARAPSPATG